jgi:outer membrane protein TolC
MVLRNTRIGWAFAAIVVVGGCRSPLDEDPEQQLLRRAVDDAVERELAAVPDLDERLLTTQAPSEAEATLAERRDELDKIGPMPPRDDAYFYAGRLGVDLEGEQQQSTALSLEHAITAAVANNLSIQFASLLPAINEADVVIAEAAFDALLFSEFNFDRIDQPTRVPVLNGFPLGTAATGSESYRFDTGLRKRLVTGAEVTLSTDLVNTNNKTSDFELSPDPAWATAVRLGVSQPLLRNFGVPVNTATIRLAQNAERRAIEQLRLELLDLVASTETAYWDLALSWHELAIRQWLTSVGEVVRDKLESRLELDTTLAEFSDAVARVEQRSANEIRSRRRVREASDRLKLLQNDPNVSVASEVVYIPVDDMVDAPISYSGRDAILTALQRRPEIQQAILNIDDASVREMLADNQRLPLLNLAAEMAYLGLDDDLGNSYDNLNDGSFVDYVVGLALEIPIGNREAEAGFRAARLERSAAVIAYRQAVQNAVFDVKRALRDVVANFELLSATRSSRVAAAENLRTLIAQEETLASLTPEFLNLKLNRQESLAEARFAEVEALVAFDRAVAELYRAMGIGLEMNRISLEIDELDESAGNASSR